MKITLTGAALRAYIKDNGEDFILELRRGIIREAAKHCKILIGANFDKQIEVSKDQITKAMNKVAIAKIGKFITKNSIRRFQLTKGMQSWINTAVQEAIKEETWKLVKSTAMRKFIEDEAKTAQDYLERQIDDVIKNQVTDAINKQIKEGIQKRLDAVLKG